MEYTGKLYGKIGNKYFDTGITSENYDSSIKALNQISNPIAYLQDEAEKAGCNLNGLVAIELTKDPGFFKDIADKALKSINSKNS